MLLSVEPIHHRRLLRPQLTLRYAIVHPPNESQRCTAHTATLHGNDNDIVATDVSIQLLNVIHKNPTLPVFSGENFPISPAA